MGIDKVDKALTNYYISLKYWERELELDLIGLVLHNINVLGHIRIDCGRWPRQLSSSPDGAGYCSHVVIEKRVRKLSIIAPHIKGRCNI